MAISKRLLASFTITLVIVGVRSDSMDEADFPYLSYEANNVESKAKESSELDTPQSPISALAEKSSIEDKTKILEIKTEEDSISDLNRPMQEKISKIASLEGEIRSPQADVPVNELEQQIVKLQNEIEVQCKKRSDIQTRICESERNTQELSLKLESLQMVNEEQKLRIRKTQNALELAEEELMKAQLLATSKAKVLTQLQMINEEQKLRIRNTQHALELAEEELMKAQALATSKVKELTEFLTLQVELRGWISMLGVFLLQ